MHIYTQVRDNGRESLVSVIVLVKVQEQCGSARRESDAVAAW